MRARYTPHGFSKADVVDVAEFVAEELDGPAQLRDRKMALALGRLIDLLAANGVMTGGQVLHVLGYTNGRLEVEDV